MSKTKVRASDAFESGRKAKRHAWARISPYYDNPALDHFWFAGYDGKDFDSAVDSQISNPDGSLLVCKVGGPITA